MTPNSFNKTFNYTQEGEFRHLLTFLSITRLSVVNPTARKYIIEHMIPGATKSRKVALSSPYTGAL